MKKGHDTTKVQTGSPEECSILQAHIQSRLDGQLRGFHVELQNGGLVLDGQTHTYHAKQLAQHAVMQASELPSVANNIVVR